jgi:hypothetical protein
MRKNEFIKQLIESISHFWNGSRPTRLLLSFLGLALLFCSFGCAPSASPGDGKQNESASSASSDIPEITEEKIREEINDVYIRDVPEENGTGEPIGWGIDGDEPRELTVVDKQMEGDRATITIDIKTQSSPRARAPKYLAGQIRTKWRLETGWALRTWEIVETENISMKYKNLPKPPPQNSNR